MNNTQPNGQNLKTPILNISNIGNVKASIVTLSINTTLPDGLSIYGCSANYRNPSCPSLNASQQTVLRSGVLVNASKGIWLFVECINVEDNQSISINYTVGAS
jgi:hypothetical protein